jgi:hypothetical protein
MDGFNLDEWVCPYCGCLNYNLQTCVRCKQDKTSPDALQHKILAQIKEIHDLKVVMSKQISNVYATLNDTQTEINLKENELKQLQREYQHLLDEERNLTFQQIFRQPIKLIAEDQKQLEI